MRQGAKVIGIFCSCLHLSHRPPALRTAEPDWYNAMGRAIAQLKELSSNYSAPIFCAGDVFDRWDDAPAELINFAMSNLPRMYAVPGQHDLPYHRTDLLNKSPFFTLVKSGTIKMLECNKPTTIKLKSGVVITAYGLPWGMPLSSVRVVEKNPYATHVLVIHKYVWSDKVSYPKAKFDPDTINIKELAKLVPGFHSYCIGDNHIGFSYHNANSTWSFNCGTFMRRKADELEYNPRVGLLLSNNDVVPYRLDTSLDIYTNIDYEISKLEKSLNVDAFVGHLTSLGGDSIDFVEAVHKYCRHNKVSKRVACLLDDIMNGSKLDGSR